MARLVFALCSGLSSAHFLYLKEGVPGKAIVTFGEGGTPGSAYLLSGVADLVHVMSTVKSTISENVTLAQHVVRQGSALNSSPFVRLNAELAGTFSATPPFSLQLSTLYGIHSESLLVYTSSADVVTTYTDWLDVQEWGMQSGLDITIRDPYGDQSGLMELGLREAFPGDQCEPGQQYQDGDACVLAVVRFAGAPFNADMNVTTFAGDGSTISTTFQPAQANGMVILKVPLDVSATYTEVLAKVNYREATPGEYDGQAYQVVDRWATTYARIVRASDHDRFIV